MSSRWSLSFEDVSPEARREADLFFEELQGRPRPRAIEARTPRHHGESDEQAEDVIDRVSGDVAQAVSCPRHSRRPTVLEALCWGQAYFRFVKIKTKFTGSDGVYKGRFWVLDDALKWLVPASFPGYLEEYDAMTLKVKDWTRTSTRLRNWRLPCKPSEAQAAADQLKMAQGDLRGGGSSSSSTKEPSLLLTPHLYDARYAQADLKISPQTSSGGKSLMTINVNQGLNVASIEYNRLVHKAARSITHAWTKVPRMLADPGKIWALTNTVGDRYKSYVDPQGRPRCRPDANGHRATPNYGWHTTPSNARAVIQGVGNCHDASHIDYSQIFMVAAGWCKVKRPGGSFTWMRTAEVYQSDDLHKLVTRGNKLRRIRYDWLP